MLKIIVFIIFATFTITFIIAMYFYFRPINHNRKINIASHNRLAPTSNQTINHNRKINIASHNRLAPTSNQTTSCYGTGDPVCNTCEDVIVSYAKRGWQVHINDFEQCRGYTCKDDIMDTYMRTYLANDNLYKTDTHYCVQD